MNNLYSARRHASEELPVDNASCKLTSCRFILILFVICLCLRRIHKKINKNEQKYKLFILSHLQRIIDSLIQFLFNRQEKEWGGGILEICP